MAIWLKQSTTVTIKFGPLVDAGDGNTPETGEATNLDSATTGIRVAKAGGDMGDRNSATAPTHDEVGIYNVELNATDTGTLGMLKVSYDGSTVCLPHWMEFMVVSANTWDSFFGADNLDVNTAQVGGQTASASGTVTFPNATIASTTNITSATGVTVSTVSDKTGYSLTQAFPTNFSSMGIEADGHVHADVKEWDGLASVVTRFKNWISEGTAGTADSGTTTTLVDAALTQGDDVWNGALIVFTSGTNAGKTAVCTDFDAASDTATFVPALGTGVTTEGYTMIPGLGWAIVEASNDKTGYSITGDLSATMKTSVNTEIVDALNTDTITLPGQEAPPLAPTHRQAIGWLYKVLRNRTTQTSTTWSLFNDAESVVDAKATVSDDGTTATVQEIVSGP